MNDSTRPATALLPWPALALAGWVLPGLGHVLLGEHKRGLILGVTLVTLFLAGMLVGGIDVIDRRENTIWFAGQVLVGPIAIAASETHIYLDAQDRVAEPRPGRSKYERSIGRVNELGTLYCTLAGALNLLAILDVVGRETSPPTPRRRADDRLDTRTPR